MDPSGNLPCPWAKRLQTLRAHQEAMTRTRWGSLGTRVTWASNASIVPGSVPVLVMMMGGSRVVERHTGRKVLILSLIEALVTACPCSNAAEPRRDDKPRTFPSEAGCTASSSFSRAHRGPGAEQQRCPGAPGAPRSQGPSGPPQGDPCSAARSFGASAFACYLCSGSLLVSERLPQLQPLC